MIILYTKCIIINLLNSVIMENYYGGQVDDKHKPIKQICDFPYRLKLCYSTYKGSKNIKNSVVKNGVGISSFGDKIKAFFTVKIPSDESAKSENYGC